MLEFIPGQRWINDAELQLGLGTVLAVEHRTVQIVFLASGETRVYAKQTAPLTRVRFSPGDEIQSDAGETVRVNEVLESEGILIYRGLDQSGAAFDLPETMLDNYIQLNKPQERLFTGQIDSNAWFEVRYRGWAAKSERARSEANGLTGARTSLIPHQLYIANEVAHRFAPRVLLADEVGLGKTIEAGLILHHQLLNERAHRALVVVPEALVHQWLVEMLRKFNLHFSIFDEERLANAMQVPNYDGDELMLDVEDVLEAELSDAPSATASSNPFLDEQLVLCDLNFLCSNPEALQMATEAEWDLLIVDEAHHLQWSEANPSQEYTVVEQLARQTPGVLLLTATPEQLGQESHFARLRLLDPDRFNSFADFQQEENTYAPIADAIEMLMDERADNSQLLMALVPVLNVEEDQHLLDNLSANDEHSSAARADLINHLLDRHGTGRVLFRNTRAAISGFPGRKLHAHPLPLPADFVANSITPEHQCRESNPAVDWTSIDPRVGWLLDLLKQNRKDKFLLITAHADTALELVEAMRVQTGFQAAVFHEDMSIVERDRAAAFFADMDYGSQLLICSEIGSEGRNFQFAHHLVLFDLPSNPDLLEQRIGRLDRIGQTETINIHVPFFENTSQQLLYQWYHDGLNAIELSCPAAHAVYVEFTDRLHQALAGNHMPEALLAETRERTTALNEKMHEGRDRLLEYNSCRKHVAERLAELAAQEDEQSTLPEYMEAVFDCFGVHSEPHSANASIVRPAENMFAPFPMLEDDGMTITFDRATALANEDLHFLTWDHRMVIGALDMVLGNEQGNCSAIAVKTAGLKPGTLLLETVYVLESPQQSSRYLPPSTLRILLDERAKPLQDAVSFELLCSAAQSLDRKTAIKVVKARTVGLENLLNQSRNLASQSAEKLTTSAHAEAEHTLREEIDRLEALRKVNPNVRAEEITAFEEELNRVNNMIDSTALRLDALRIVVAV